MSVGVGEGMVGVGCGVAVGVGVVLSQAIDKMIASIPTSNRKPIGRTSLSCRISRSLSHLLTYDRYYLSDTIAHSRITAESASGTYAEVMVTASTASTTMAATGIRKRAGLATVDPARTDKMVPSHFYPSFNICNLSTGVTG